MFINGIVPPCPMKPHGAPKWALLALCKAWDNQGATSGAFHPVAPPWCSKVTRAWYGALSSSKIFISCTACAASTKGGKRKLSLKAV
jgi:hypothetical protein